MDVESRTCAGAGPEAAAVLVFPPLVPMATVAAACFLQWLAPIGVLVRVPAPARLVAAGVLGAAGIAMMVAGALALARNRTAIRPARPTRVLVDGGIFALTRNPLYVGGCMVMLGIAAALALDWLVLLFPASVAAMHFGIVVREERYLEALFGDRYRSYKARVPRYLGIRRQREA